MIIDVWYHTKYAQRTHQQINEVIYTVEYHRCGQVVIMQSKKRF